MRMTVMLLSLIGAGSGCASESSVKVCLPLDPEVNYRTIVLAEGYATRIYREIGIDLRWKSSCRAADVNAKAISGPNFTTLGIQWSAKAPPALDPTARASAYPFENAGTRIILYRDRLAPILVQEKNLAGAVLGHVLAHEIGHVLLRHNNHALEGLMKPSWSNVEETGMRWRLLRFTAEQAAQIKMNLNQETAAPTTAKEGLSTRSTQPDTR